MDKLTSWGQSGISVMVPVAGSAFYGITAAIKNGAPWVAVLSIVLLLAWLYIGPCVFGKLLYNRRKKLAVKE